MQNTKKRIVELIAESSWETCTVCGTTKTQAVYKYKSMQMVSDYIPPLQEPVCRKCVYREVYGSKNYRKKMKERSLDGKL